MTEYPFKLYEPMLVGSAPKNWQEVLKKEKIIGTTKKDGAYYTLVKENNQVPRFRINVTTRQEVVVYETLFYNVYKYRDQIYVDEHKSIDDINWQVILKKLKISSNQ